MDFTPLLHSSKSKVCLAPEILLELCFFHDRAGLDVLQLTTRSFRNLIEKYSTRLSVRLHCFLAFVPNGARLILAGNGSPSKEFHFDPVYTEHTSNAPSTTKENEALQQQAQALRNGKYVIDKIHILCTSQFGPAQLCEEIVHLSQCCWLVENLIFWIGEQHALSGEDVGWLLEKFSRVKQLRILPSAYINREFRRGNNQSILKTIVDILNLGLARAVSEFYLTPTCTLEDPPEQAILDFCFDFSHYKIDGRARMVVLRGLGIGNDFVRNTVERMATLKQHLKIFLMECYINYESTDYKNLDKTMQKVTEDGPVYTYTAHGVSILVAESRKAKGIHIRNGFEIAENLWHPHGNNFSSCTKPKNVLDSQQQMIAFWRNSFSTSMRKRTVPQATKKTDSRCNSSEERQIKGTSVYGTRNFAMFELARMGTCKASLLLEDEENLTGVLGSNEHNHVAAPSRQQAETRRQHMKEQIQANPRTRPFRLRAHGRANVDDEVFERMGADEALDKMVCRVKNKLYGNVNRANPLEIQIPPELLMKDGESILIYDSRNTRPDQADTVLVFSHSQLLDLLKNNRRWSLDGTFSSAPRPWTQVLVIGCYVGSRLIVAVQALLPGKKSTYYREVLDVVRRMVNPAQPAKCNYFE
ncbi:hypothetical protein DdX_11843 [Ditylenchus destructor]|uniref:Uncharacterized protein n=1 Tax=Ditylenchus destructor TaxID=166010 RepID=A0AAD4MXG4_9BILA|nr:hypothetical protein DdX_11843 [Ditylenchus destructor]